MSAPGKEGVEGTDEADYKWGEEKPKGNYKSVSIRGEAYDVGHCVQCNLESKEAYIWKILKLFQRGDRKMCRIRRLFREAELPRNVKGLDPSAEAKELFLASQGPDMQEDIPLAKIARKFKIFCTFQDDDGLNPIPSSEQIKDADYFFHRGYDPASEEVVALDGVVDELGAQYVYNKNWWFGDSVGRPSSSQISGGRIPSQSPASGSSAHQGVAQGMYSSVLEVSPAPSRDSTERKLKKRKSDNVAPEQEKDAVVKTNEFHAPKKPKVEKSTVSRSDHIVFAIPAPAFIDSLRGPGVSPGSAKPPTSKSKPIQREGKGYLVKSSGAPAAPVSLKQAETKGGVSADRKRDSEGTVKRTVRTGDRSNAPSATSLGSKQALKKDGEGSVERPRKIGEKPSEAAVKKAFKPPGERPIASSGNHSKLQKRAGEAIVMTTSHGASAPTSLSKKSQNPSLVISTDIEIPNATKTGRSTPGESPRAPKEVVKTDVASRVLERDEDAPNAPTTSQRQSGSPSLNVTARKGDGFTAKDSSRLNSSPHESPRATSSTRMSDRDIDVTELPLAASPQKKSEKPVFKKPIEDWDATIASAVQSQRVLLLKNVDPELHSEDFSEALTTYMKAKCEVRIAPPVSFSYRTTTALLKLPSFKIAQEFLEKTKSNQLLVADRVVTATSFSPADFKAPPLKFHGHLDFSQTLRDQHVEDYKNAVATSHLAQGNTIEFAYGLPWRVLDEQHEDQWRLLQEAHSRDQDRTDI